MMWLHNRPSNNKTIIIMNKGELKINTRVKANDNMDASSPYSYINKFNNMVYNMDKYSYQTKYPELFPWDLKVQNFK